MLKKILVLMAMLYAAACFAAVDINKANAAELDSIKGIGPAISGRILDERKKGGFKDWGDFIKRVKGVGEGNAAKFSSQGLTVDGAAYKQTQSTSFGEKAQTAVVPDKKASTPKTGASASIKK